MTTSLHYRLRKLSGTIEDLGERRDSGSADALDSVHHSVIRVRESGGVVALDNVVVPVQVEACLAPGVRCDLYLVEAQAQICSPAYRKCAADGAFSHVFAIVCGDQCVDAIGPTVRHFGELKQFGLDQVEARTQRELSLAELSLIIQGMPPSETGATAGMGSPGAGGANRMRGGKRMGSETSSGGMGPGGGGMLPGGSTPPEKMNPGQMSE